jgi:signal transduction histidine kinase
MLYFYNIEVPGGCIRIPSQEGRVGKSQQAAGQGLSPEQQAKCFRLLADLAQHLSAQDDPRSLQEEILAQSLQFFDCASGAMFLLRDDGKDVSQGPAVGRAEGLHIGALLEVAPVRQTVLAAAKPLVLEAPGLTLGPEFDGWKGMAVVPLAGRGRVVGVLVLGDRRDGRVFSDLDAAMMAAMGNMAGASLETNVAFAEFRQEMSHRMTEGMAELSRASAELARIKQLDDSLFVSVPVGIILFDREFRVTFRNSAAERLWPADRSVLAAARRTDLERRDPGWEAALRDVVNMQRPWRAEQVAFERRGREPVRVNLSSSPLLSGERGVVGGVLVVEDVTASHRMEERLAVSERLAGVGRLASMVAHEINNPLDGIIRLVNLARRVGAEGGDARLETYLAQADKGLNRLGTVVRELLEFSRSASGAVVPMPIRDILAEAAEGVAPKAREAGVTVSVDCASDLPSLKSGILYHVVLNLVKNAVEAMPDGGEVRVGASVRDDTLVIEVADTGPGIPEENLPRLFEPFFTRKQGGQGTGLGLVISKDLVEKQGGSLTAANRPEGGARFTISIPLAPGASGRLRP